MQPSDVSSFGTVPFAMSFAKAGVPPVTLSPARGTSRGQIVAHLSKVPPVVALPAAAPLVAAPYVWKVGLPPNSKNPKIYKEEEKLNKGTALGTQRAGVLTTEMAPKWLQYVEQFPDLPWVGPVKRPRSAEAQLAHNKRSAEKMKWTPAQWEADWKTPKHLAKVALRKQDQGIQGVLEDGGKDTEHVATSFMKKVAEDYFLGPAEAVADWIPKELDL